MKLFGTSNSNSFQNSVLICNFRDDRVAFAVELKEEMEQMKKQLENLRHEVMNFFVSLCILRSSLNQLSETVSASSYKTILKTVAS